MVDLLSRFKIRTRIGVALAVPLLGLLVLAAIAVGGQWRIAGEMDRLNALAKLAPEISAMVHELQKERGTSAGFIGRKGQGAFAEKLTNQRQATDGQYEQFAAAINAFDTAAYGPVFQGKLKEALDMLSQLQQQRAAVSALSLTVGEMAKYYTTTIARLLGTVGEMAVLSTDARVANSIAAYISFLQAKERAGIERAMGANGFGKGSFAPAIHQRFVSLVAQQQAFLSIFRAYASQSQRAYLAETQKAEAFGEVERMRGLAIGSAYGGDLGGVTGPVWFDTITQKINLLKDVEDRIAADLQAQVSTLGGQAERTLFIEAVLTLALLIGTIAVVTVAVRSVTGPLARTTEQVKVLASGDLSIEIDGAARRDELGEMARAVQIFKDQGIEAERQSKERRRERERGEQEKRDAIRSLAADVEASLDPVVSEVSTASNQLRVTAEGLSTAASQTSDRANDVSSAADQASANVQTVASAAEELSSSIGEITRQVSQSREISGKAVTEADRASETV
ncbi:MAG TPA: HAMP domain-containing protein, partial [Kiloniellaceae bacterium]|nr:HAMP domain-containing protein [Kiloniellaceae bacterium]